MKSKLVHTITNNEDDARLRIFEGDLKIGDAAADLLATEKSQHAATRFWAQKRIDDLEAILKSNGLQTYYTKKIDRP